MYKTNNAPKWTLTAMMLLLGICNSQAATFSSSSVSNQRDGKVYVQRISSSQGYPFSKPEIQLSRGTYRVNPYTSVYQMPLLTNPAQVAQDRFFDIASTAASIVPGLFGKPFWTPHRYFNLCPTIQSSDNSLWGMACSSFPMQVSGGQPVTWASAGAGAGFGVPYPPLSPYQPAAALGLPAGFPPAMTPFYANLGWPQIVPNDPHALDLGNLFSYGSTNGAAATAVAGAGNIGILGATNSDANSALYYNPLLANSATGGALYSTYGAHDLAPMPFPFSIPYMTGSNWNRIQTGSIGSNSGSSSVTSSSSSISEIVADERESRQDIQVPVPDAQSDTAHAQVEVSANANSDSNEPEDTLILQ